MTFMEIILSVAIAVFIFVLIYFLLLLNDLRRTLQEVYFILRDLHKELNPIVKNVEELTRKSGELVEDLDNWAQDLYSKIEKIRISKKILKADGKLIPILVSIVGLLLKIVKRKTSKEGGNKS